VSDYTNDFSFDVKESGGKTIGKGKLKPKIFEESSPDFFELKAGRKVVGKVHM